MRIDFVLWMCLYPLCYSIWTYVNIKKHVLLKNNIYHGWLAIEALVSLIIYYYLAIKLY
jgi:hypothetical protein